MVVHAHHWYTSVKYLVYCLLAVNIFIFLNEELAALEHTYSNGFAASDIIQAFSATIDTAAWVVLLLLFELETYVLDDSRIRGRLKWTLHGVRVVCYLFIGYALYGYVGELAALYQIELLNVADACALLGGDWWLLIDLDEYEALSAANCVGLSAPYYQVTGNSVLADAEQLRAAQLLAWVDVVNAFAWVLVVLVLEVDVRLQLRGGYSDHLVAINTIIKVLVYLLLLAAAVYWGLAGAFIDFWDAFLWLFAFVFIEMNVFDWQAETRAAN